MGADETVYQFTAWTLKGRTLSRRDDGMGGGRVAGTGSDTPSYDMAGASASLEIAATKPSTGKVLLFGMLAFSKGMAPNRITVTVTLATGQVLIIETESPDSDVEAAARAFVAAINATGVRFGQQTSTGSVPTASAAPADDDRDPIEMLAELGKLRDEGVLTDIEFQAKKRDILGRI